MTGATLVIQATSSRQGPTRGRHRKQSSRRWISNSKRTVLGTFAALLAAFGLLIGLAVKSMQEAPQPMAGPEASPSSAPAAPAPVTPSEPDEAETTSGRPALFATDEKGFVNSNARCDGAKRAAAIGRTKQSVVVICVGDDGRYEYLGVRLSDDAVMRTSAETTPSHGFVAHNASVTYAVSATELLVMEGDSVIKHEPMLEYHGSEPAESAIR
jgi:hypothetical protein